jgi:hypothetical protein
MAIFMCSFSYCIRYLDILSWKGNLMPPEEELSRAAEKPRGEINKLIYGQVLVLSWRLHIIDHGTAAYLGRRKKKN